jgi:mycofactocin precursor
VTPLTPIDLQGVQMPETQQDTRPAESTAPAAEPVPVGEALVEESLVEEVSIDGMCGVY